MTWEEMVVARSKIISQHVTGRTKKKKPIENLSQASLSLSQHLLFDASEG
jgi:hypothetical protein